MVVLNSPHELREELKQEGLSVWLYRVERDETRVNIPDERLPGNLVRPPPLPLRLHYLMTPVTFKGPGGAAPDVEHRMLGRVMQTLYSRPILQGADLQNTDLEAPMRNFMCTSKPSRWMSCPVCGRPWRVRSRSRCHTKSPL